VARLILGTAQLGMTYGVANTYGQPSFDESIEMLRHASVDGIDTAPGYGTAEDLIGIAQPSVAVTTKLDPTMSPVESVDRSRRRLDLDVIDTVLLHDASLVDHDPHGVVDAAAELVAKGVVNRIGASIYSPRQLAQVIADPRLSMCQIPLNVVDHRWSDGLLADAAASGTELVARSVFLQGALLMHVADLPSHLAALGPAVTQLRAAADRSGRSLLELALVGVRDRAGVSGVVLGAERPAQLAEIASAMSAPMLTPAERAALASLPRIGEAVLDPRRWFARHAA
jgi:aryl-alcohol dehydrogenase-like predicted oxidoreductase